MCSLCLRTPCASGCPNAEEPKPAYICGKCGNGIFIGEKMFIAPKDGPICESCMENMSYKELLDILGETMDIVE